MRFVRPNKALLTLIGCVCLYLVVWLMLVAYCLNVLGFVFVVLYTLIPLWMVGKIIIEKLPFLSKQMGTIWMSGAIIGIFMFGAGVFYALKK